MKDFIASYYRQVFTAVMRLAQPGDQRTADSLTREILSDLREQKELLETETRKGVFIYKVVLGHVFSYLTATGETAKMENLRKILPIKEKPI